MLFIILPWNIIQAENHPRFVYRIGILSSNPAHEARSQWIHLGYYLRDRIPEADFAIIPLQYAEIEKALNLNELDFVLTNPAQHVILNEVFGVECIATIEGSDGTPGQSLYGGVVFVRSDQDQIHTWEDLKGKKFAAINEGDFGGWLTVWRELKARGQDPFRDFRSLRFLGSQEKVVDAVLGGEVNAGSLRTGALEKMAAEGRIRLEDFRIIRDEDMFPAGEKRISTLFSTRLYPEWPMARTKRVPQNLAKKVAIELLQMQEDDLAAVAGGFSGWTVHESYDSVIACLKEIGFGPYRHKGPLRLITVLKVYKWPILSFLSLFILLCGVSFYVVFLNRKLSYSKNKLEEEIRAKTAIETELRRNEMALKNMITDLAETHGSLQSTRDQLLQSEKLAAIGQLAAGVAHELNNPLGFVSSNLEILCEYWDKTREILDLFREYSRRPSTASLEEKERILEEIDRKSALDDLDFMMQDAKNIHAESVEGLERMRRIVMDLKTFSRDDRSGRSLEDVGGIMESILGIVHNEMKYKADLVKEYTPHLPAILCNKQQIGQVFINILLNAVQAIKEKGRITISIYRDETMIKVDIADTGIGIPLENMKRIFDPFFSTKEVGQGTGLGLGISYDIVHKHGGKIDVKSQVGVGTVFTISLPIKPAP